MAPGSSLSIALLGWARLALQEREGSGYNLNVSELARALVHRGHRVSYLRSGMEFSLKPALRLGSHEPWQGVRCDFVFNSPNLAPAFFNFGNITPELDAPELTRLVLQWLDTFRADIVHIHSLEGFSLDLPAAIRATGRPVVITPHNHWYLCPQVDLLYREREVCENYDGGNRCVSCLAPPSRARVKASASAARALERSFHLYTDPSRALWQRALRRLAAPPRASIPTDAPPPPIPADQGERFLRANAQIRVLNHFGQRRAAGLAALDAASLVTPPSPWLCDVLSTMGVDESRLRLVRLGQPHFDALRHAALARPDYATSPWSPADPRPLRFSYFGPLRYHKGIHVLAEAVERLPPAVAAKSRFLIRAGGPLADIRIRLQRHANVDFGPWYALSDLPTLLSKTDILLYPQICFDNSPLVMLEALHAGKPVIASDLGGPTGWITPPHNGLLFPPGNADALAAAIASLVRGEVPLPSAKSIHERTILPSHDDHVDEVEGIYHAILRQTPTPPAPHLASAQARSTPPTPQG